MNSGRNSGKACSWSAVPLGTTIGASAGFLFSVVAPVLVFLTGSGFLLVGTVLVVYFPLDCIYKLLGWELPYSAGGRSVTWGALFGVALLNAALVGILGAALGFLVRLLKRANACHEG